LRAFERHGILDPEDALVVRGYAAHVENWWEERKGTLVEAGFSLEEAERLARRERLARQRGRER
jgi:hypothetical protein